MKALPPLPPELEELRKRVKELPLRQRTDLLPLVEWLVHYTRLQDRLSKLAHEINDQLCLDVHYLEFDLEATRRERDALYWELFGNESE